MKTYNKPSLEIIDSLSDDYCAVAEVVSDNEVFDRVIISADDLLD